MTFTASDLDRVFNDEEAYGPDTDYAASLIEVYYGEYDYVRSPLGKITKVDSGPEDPGDGKAIWLVVKVEGDDRLFRVWGYYSSWDSSVLDGDFEEVETYERTITDYRKV